MEIRWSPEAAQDLERIFKGIQQDNPTAVREVVKTLYDGCSALKVFPSRGRVSRIKGRRELVFPFLAVRCGVLGQGRVVEISRIYHGAQDWP
jgi:plasmid stabilization system protein ParE